MAESRNVNGAAQGDQNEDRFLISSYLDWVVGEDVPILEGFMVDLRTAEVGPWDRFGVKGAVVNVAGRGDYLDLWLLELGKGASTTPQSHMFEAVAYVISGHGSTSVETADGTHTFEWGPKSMFALPLNYKYQLFNASGSEPARIALTTAFPIMMNLFKNDDFIFNCDWKFPERFALAKDFAGTGTHKQDLAGSHERNFWVTNFVADLAAFGELRGNEIRGKSSKGIVFLMAEGVLHGHMSEIPVGSYKKAHRHMGGTHIYPVTGQGYSLLWYEGDTERTRIDWEHGVCYSPPDNMYHQHFNVSDAPARYFAVKFGNYRYPVTNRMRNQQSAGSKELAATKTQIEYADEHTEIRALYLEELAKSGRALTL